MATPSFHCVLDRDVDSDVVLDRDVDSDVVNPTLSCQPNSLVPLLMPMYSPDPTLRQPLTLAAVFPVLLCYYAQAVLAILPNTFIFKLLFLPFILWQAWRCAIGYDMAALQAQMVGRQSADRFGSTNLMFMVRPFSKTMSPEMHLLILKYRPICSTYR